MYRRSTVFAVFALLAAIIFLPLRQASGQGLQIHPRIGSELDGEERRYFNLFRQWPDGSITVGPAPDDSLQFRLADSSGVFLTVHSGVLESLGAYLDHFEDTDRIRTSVNFADLRGIAGYRNRFRVRTTPSLTALSGEQVSNPLLYVDSERMLVLVGDGPYDWRDANERVRILRPDELGQVTQPRSILKSGPRLLVGVAGTLLPFLAVNRDLGPDDGTGLIGMAGAIYLGYSWAMSPMLLQPDGQPDAFASASEKLAGHVAFADGLLAPEITIPFGARSLFSSDASARARFQPRTRVSISTDMLISFSEREAFAATGFGLINLDPRNLPWLKIVVDKDRSHALSYGAEAMIALNTDLEQPALGYSGQLLTAFSDWHFARPAELQFASRWSVAVGAGLTIGRMTSNTELDWSRQITNLAPELEGTTSIGQKSWIGGVQLRASASYRLDDSKLARLQLSGWIPPLALGEKDRNVGSNTIYGFDRVSMPVGVSLGVVHELGPN